MVRLAVRRYIPFIGYHHVLMIICIIVIIFFSILLAGCTSESLKDIYLISFSYHPNSAIPSPSAAQVTPNISATFAHLTNDSSHSLLEVRANYMGLCVLSSTSSWFCSTSPTSLATLMRTGNVADPLNLIWIAGKFKDDIIFNGLLFTAIPLTFITFLLLASFPGWHEEIDENGSDREVKPFPSKPVSQIALVAITIVAIFSFVSVFWQHIGASATLTLTHALTYGAVSGHVGPSAMSLGWVGVFLSFVITVGLLIMIVSIRILSSGLSVGTSSGGSSMSIVDD